MNRNIVSVLLGGYGTDSTAKGPARKVEGEAQFADVPSTIELLTNSKKARVLVYLCVRSRLHHTQAATSPR